ncbi:AraC family transcriptional regulator [Marinomonas dokdonensis]|uniref:AraC family transcriptional regulator n=1 Tax=Marinomonas dokdonensis TaxID=328224 RepID=UPI0040553C1F
MTIKQFIQQRMPEDGLQETGISGVRLFRVSEPHQCAPAVYEPSIVAIVSGCKEAILDGRAYRYDNQHYLACSMSMPLEAGTPEASPEEPLLGVYITLDIRLMAEIALEIQAASSHSSQQEKQPPSGISLCPWQPNFTEALHRLLELSTDPTDTKVLGESRLKELYYTVLKGSAGSAMMQAFGIGNSMARMIEQISSRLSDPLTIDEMASQVGMSRAVFHRKFKQATHLSPMQFIKSMRLNSAAMNIAAGMNVNEAAYAVGYASPSQFNREFKRLYGQPPRQWSHGKWAK